MRRQRKRRRLARFNLRKAMFVLPNLFTLSSVFCGFYAIVLTSGDAGPTQLYRATLAVFFGLFFDMADGRVARLTRTQSDFGVQIDSLADVVTFGAAPAMIVYKWGLARLGLLGAVAAFVYLACGTIRLARFNVMAARSDGSPGNHFIGLPIPIAAGVVVSLVMYHQQVIATPVVREGHILILLLVLSYLMVSNVRYRSFKKTKMSPQVAVGLVAFLVAFVAVAMTYQPSLALFVFLCCYLAWGLVEEVVFFRRRRRHERSGPPAEVSSGEESGKPA